MKKILLGVFSILLFPVVGYASCQQAQSGDFEFSECMFEGQGLSSAAKSFWGNPKVDSSVTLSSSGDTGNFVLFNVYQCGYCKADSINPLNPSQTSIKFLRPSNSKSKFRGDCSSMALNEKGVETCSDGTCTAAKADDEMIIAYIAKDISAHGAEFCLQQISGASWDHPEFFLYYQIPSTLYKDPTISKNLGCMWFCEPGWDGDRCEKQGIPDYMPYSGVSPKNGVNYFNNNLKQWNKDTAYTNIFEEPECADCSSAVQSIAVLDYKKTGKKQHCSKTSCWDAPSYQQEIVIGATKFNEHGIVARPILLGSNGGHHPCYNVFNKVNDKQDLTSRAFLVGTTGVFSKTADGGTERVLCLQGYTKNANCDSYDGIANAQVCDDYLNNSYDTTKHYKIYNSTKNCLQYACINGMSYSEQDSYSCSFCQETASQGLCKTDKTCTSCGNGQCIDSTGCGCTACGTVLTKTMMESGKNLISKCWGIIDTEDFRSCVLGEKISSDDDE